MTDDSHRFTPIARIGADEGLPLHEGKTFHQYSDRWKAEPRYAIRFDAMLDKPNWLRASTHYRLAFREISRSTDDRTMISTIVPPGYLFGHKGTCEKTPWKRADATALILCAVFNSFAFDWCVRRKIAASVSLFMLNGCPAPVLPEAAARFLAHGALRLACRHAGYSLLWREQLQTSDLSAADLLNVEDRAMLRAAVDAVVAQAYGLERDDYHHILTSFSHKVHPDAPARCQEAFDLLTRNSDQAFYRQFDPFTDVPLVDHLSLPDIEMPIASATLTPSIAAERIPPA
jgi:hypothetical protein